MALQVNSICKAWFPLGICSPLCHTLHSSLQAPSCNQSFTQSAEACFQNWIVAGIVQSPSLADTPLAYISFTLWQQQSYSALSAIFSLALGDCSRQHKTLKKTKSMPVWQNKKRCKGIAFLLHSLSIGNRPITYIFAY